jgi:GTP-binding protein Era
LINAILGQTVSVVSPKPQTTRNRIVGIHNLPGVQLILVDTPGLSPGRHELGRRMLRGAREAVSDADVVVRVIDATKWSPSSGNRDDAALLSRGKRTVVALNKVDLVRPKERLLPLMAALAELENVEAVVPISALRGAGVDDLVNELAQRMPEGEPFYPPEMVTDRPERFLAAEVIRATVLRQTREEVPHAAAVEVQSWRDSDKGCHIEAVIYVEKSSQKAIVVGRGGEMIKKIGTAARLEIGRVLDCQAHVMLRVEVAEGWRGDPKALRQLGYDE